MTALPFTSAKQVLTDATLWVTSEGHVWKRINGSHPERRQWSQRKMDIDKDGYSRCRISGKSWYMHRLVYSLFVGELIPDLVVCHIDGDNTNNSFTNLTQQTQAVNISHKRGHGTHQAGEQHPFCKHTNESILQVKRLLTAVARSKTGRIKRGERQRIAYETGVSMHTVSAIESRNGWATV